MKSLSVFMLCLTSGILGSQLSPISQTGQGDLSKLELKDAKGNVRISLDAAAADGPNIRLMDAKGRTVLNLNGDFNRGEVQVFGPKESPAHGTFAAGKKLGVGIQLEDSGGEAFFGFPGVTAHAVLALVPKEGEAQFLPTPTEDESK